MINRFWRPIKEGFLGVFRHGANSFSSATAVTITLLIISLFLIFTVNVRRFTLGLEQEVQIACMVDYDYESAEQEDRISLAIQNIEGVKSVQYSSKADEFQYYIDSFDDQSTKEAFEPFRESNPMHDAFYVEVNNGTSIEDIAAQIEKIEGISKVRFGGAEAVKLINALRSVRTIGGIIALALSALAILLIQNTIKVTIQSRADEIAIMRNVGAKNGFIRSPFVIEGVIIGALGAIIPMILTYFGYKYLYDLTDGHLISDMFTLIEPIPFVYQLCLALLAIGMIVGLIGSYFSVSRYLRWKR